MRKVTSFEAKHPVVPLSRYPCMSITSEGNKLVWDRRIYE